MCYNLSYSILYFVLLINSILITRISIIDIEGVIYKKMNTNEYKEELPSSCPPIDAFSADMVAYRVVFNYPPKEDDFFSQRKLYPLKPFKVDECIAHACSVFNDKGEILKKKKLLKHENVTIVKFNIETCDGKIKKTLSPGHYSWWIFYTCKITSKKYEEVL